MALRAFRRLHHRTGSSPHLRLNDLHVHIAQHRRNLQAGHLRTSFRKSARKDERVHRDSLGVLHNIR